jgi:hypothetical protein
MILGVVIGVVISHIIFVLLYSAIYHSHKIGYIDLSDEAVKNRAISMRITNMPLPGTLSFVILETDGIPQKKSSP